MHEQQLELLLLEPFRALPGLRLLAHLLEPPVHVISISHDQLEPQAFEIGCGIGVVRETVEHGQQRVGLAKSSRHLDSGARHVDHSNGGWRDLLRADERTEAIQTVVGDDGHAHVRLLGHRRVRRDLGARMRERVEQCRLPRVGKADDPDLQGQLVVFPGSPVLLGRAKTEQR